MKFEGDSWVVSCLDTPGDRSTHATKEAAVWHARGLARRNRPSRLLTYRVNGMLGNTFQYHLTPGWSTIKSPGRI